MTPLKCLLFGHRWIHRADHPKTPLLCTRCWLLVPSKALAEARS